MFERYSNQVRLLMRILPVIAEEDAFALKGGTAINLFVRDMPRLSVDIDLTYLPKEGFQTAVTNIAAALERIEGAINKSAPELRVQKIAGGSNLPTRLMVSQGKTSVKIETSPVLRGTVHAPVVMQVSDAVQENYGFAEVNVLAFDDLYGGKIHAALDRQHPRDLYDVFNLYENEGMSDSLFRTFLVYLASSSRPPHELLNPNFQNLDAPYAREFLGMTREEVGIKTLEDARARLNKDIQSRLNGDSAKFLLSLHNAEPDFDFIKLPGAATLPAVTWKVKNIKKLKTSNPEKHAIQRERLELLLNS